MRTQQRQRTPHSKMRRSLRIKQYVLTDNDRICLLYANPVVNEQIQKENETKIGHNG